jgi:hypothetical protein
VLLRIVEDREPEIIEIGMELEGPALYPQPPYQSVIAVGKPSVGVPSGSSTNSRAASVASCRKFAQPRSLQMSGAHFDRQ